VPILNRITSPKDLKALTNDDLGGLAAEIRQFLIKNVSRTGGHLGPNLGVVELTIALHRVFDSPRDVIIFDTGHQSYVHKILTGRQSGFPTLRQRGGLSGYPSRAESVHDWVENSHASASLSWADGMAKAFRLQGEDRCVVAVIGDGALTGGMAWEALNNIAVAGDDEHLVIVVNDNGRSYTPTVGGLATQLSGLGQQLSAIRTDRRYERALRTIKEKVLAAPVIGQMIYGLMHGFKTGVKDVLVPRGMFSDLGLKYVGPINGHDSAALELALQQAKGFGGPVLVHCITEKGRGFKAAEQNEQDRFHAVGVIDQETGEPLVCGGPTWTDAFGDELARIGATDDRVVAITAAMLHPTGLERFAKLFPDRTFDVGIAEQHAVASAAGLAAAGLHPVFAVYATFLNRAFDQVLMDVGLHQLGVTFVLDRAGVTGPDGPSHHGMWDTSFLGLVPGLQLAAPRDEQRLGEALRRAVRVDDAPTVIRYSKEALPDPLPALRQRGGVDVLFEAANPRVLVIGYGQFCGMAIDVGERLAQQGIAATVVDPVWALPVSSDLLALISEHELVISVEDGDVVGGLGSRVSQEARAAGIGTQFREFGVKGEYLTFSSRSELLADLGLTAQELARYATEQIAAAEVVAPLTSTER
jgi:1-deoxy-D-xylulose-5-phosphate synthase